MYKLLHDRSIIIYYLLSKTRVRLSFFAYSFCTLLFIVLITACSSKKFLREEELTLSSIKIESDNSHIKTSQYINYVRQRPNAKWFTLFKVPLGIYCLSSADSLKSQRKLSKFFQKIGEAPVIFDAQQTANGAKQIELALKNEGYLHASVDTFITTKKHKANVTYNLHSGNRYYINEINRFFDDEIIKTEFLADSSKTLLIKGMPLELNKLSEERSRIIKALRNRGYYYINNDYLSFDIDTLQGSLAANVSMNFHKPQNTDTLKAYNKQYIRHIYVETSKEQNNTHLNSSIASDTVLYHGIYFINQQHNPVNKRVFLSHIGVRSDSIYHEALLQNTYTGLNVLPAFSFTSVRVSPVDSSSHSLDCNIYVQRAKTNNIGLQLEGTNTAGNLGAAVALNYTNRNIFHGSELLELKIRGAFEAITGLEGYSNQNYTEWSAEANLRFPTLLVPFINIDTKRRLKASSEAKAMYDIQDRPEFHRRVLTGSWSYMFNNITHPSWQHRVDLLSINYVFMPWISDTFKRDYLDGDDPMYSVLRYSYENLFIVKTGYSFVYNSLRSGANAQNGLYKTNGFQIKCGIELAGNFLYGLSKLTHSTRNSENMYSLLGIAYSQYAKFDFDYAKSVVLNNRNSMAFHAAFGIGIPYGNSTILPYEKRYFAGGANSVRGWSVRELGPGAYKGKDGKIDFINQTGNLKLDLSVEWRTFLFWKLHGAFFIDAGNIWNTRKYPDMEDAVFKFNSFYKQIALSYGLGIRFNFNYFILRLDGGMKAINPSVTSGRLHYPITKPNFSRDFALHFAVGLPF